MKIMPDGEVISLDERRKARARESSEPLGDRMPRVTVDIFQDEDTVCVWLEDSEVFLSLDCTEDEAIELVLQLLDALRGVQLHKERETEA